FNPVSALTLGTLEQMATDAGVRGVIRGMMIEAQSVGEAHGVRFEIDVETRIGWAADVGAHRPSMLQDLERGRTLEIDALLATVVEMARLASVQTPLLDAVLALVRQRGRLGGSYP
ncbi:MAG: ketopantoate reductase C-terminal domain-containing protein, partial [Stellaceae bacterium]